MALIYTDNEMLADSNGTKMFAWVHGQFATATIYGSYNVSSLTDHGTGDFTVNFAVSADHTNYTFSASSWHGTGTSTNRLNEHASYSRSVSSLRVVNTDYSVGVTDTNMERANVIIHGGQN